MINEKNLESFSMIYILPNIEPNRVFRLGVGQLYTVNPARYPGVLSYVAYFLALSSFSREAGKGRGACRQLKAP